MAYPYGPPNAGGKLLRTSSIENLPSLLAGNLSMIQQSEGSIAIINGNDVGAISIFNIITDANANTDSLVSGVNLTDVIANRDALETLNNGLDLDAGSVAGIISNGLTSQNLIGPITDLQPLVDTNTNALSDLNCIEDDPIYCEMNSVKYQIYTLVKDAPLIYDTVVEVATGTLENDTDLADINTATATSVTDYQQLLADQVVVRDDSLSLLDTKTFPGYANTNISNTDKGMADVNALMESRYFQPFNKFNETAGLGQDCIADNLYLPFSNILPLTLDVFADKYKMADLTVKSGEVVLDDVPTSSVKWIRLNFFGNAYDTIKIVPGSKAGTFLVYDQVEGDLDDQTVECRWVYSAPPIKARTELFGSCGGASTFDQ